MNECIVVIDLQTSNGHFRYCSWNTLVSWLVCREPDRPSHSHLILSHWIVKQSTAVSPRALHVFIVYLAKVYATKTMLPPFQLSTEHTTLNVPSTIAPTISSPCLCRRLLYTLLHAISLLIVSVPSAGRG